MSMETGHFDELTLNDKAWLLHEFGEDLFSIEYYDHRIHLYALNAHFIEVYINIETKKIESIAIANYSDLDKYLSRIFLGNLNKKVTNH